MVEVKRILFPVELSEISAEIAPHVAYRADRFGAEVDVIHVVPNLTHLAGFYYTEASLVKTEEEVVKEAEQRLEAFCDRHLPAARRKVLMGDPVDVILDYIGSRKISQVIMGTHGRKGLDRIMMGSVAQRVLRRSPVPVLVVNPYRMEEEGRASRAEG